MPFAGRVSRLTSDNLTCYHTKAERGDYEYCLSRSRDTDTDPTSRGGEIMSTVSAGHMILTQTQPVGSGERTSRDRTHGPLTRIARSTNQLPLRSHSLFINLFILHSPLPLSFSSLFIYLCTQPPSQPHSN